MYDAGAGLCRGKRGRKPGRAATDDQHLAMGVARGITVGIGLVGRHAQPRRGTDPGFVERRPRRLRPHEGLVVEAGREEGREQVVDRADVEGERRPAVLRHRRQPVINLLDGGAYVRCTARGVAVNAHQRVRLLRARRQDAARAMIFERPPDQMDIVGKQRGGKRIALQPLIGTPVEGEGKPPGCRKPPGAGDAIGSDHQPLSFPSVAAPANLAASGFLPPAL